MPYLPRDVGRGGSHSAMGAGGGRALVRLPRSDVELGLEGGVEVCQVEEEGRTFQALGTVCAKAGSVRILWFRERQVILGVWRRKRQAETALERQVRAKLGRP